MVEIRKTHWMEVASEIYPEDKFEGPVDLYYKLATDLVERDSDVDLGIHALKISEATSVRAVTAAKAALSYGLSSAAYLKDGGSGNTIELDELVFLYGYEPVSDLRGKL